MNSDNTAGRSLEGVLPAMPGGALVALLLLPALLACGPDSGPIEHVETRIASRPARAVLLGATENDRFGRMAPPREEPPPSEDPGLEYELPAGWDVLESSRLRLLHFRPAGDEESVCYLTALPGDGGGTLANVNRWRSQMGYEPLTAIELEALPTHALFGGAATYVQLEGTLQAMSGAPQEGAMLAGLILTHEQFAFFLKMTGPTSVIEAEIEGFLRLAASIRISTEASEHAHDSGAAAPHVSEGASGATGATGASGSHAGLHYDTPEGWTEKPAGAMRVVAFAVGDGGTECYVAVLDGGGGGLEANINRWRGQLGQDVLGSAEIATLPKIPVLGIDAPLVEVEGDFSDMRGGTHTDHALMGTIVERRAGLLFVKMVGPREEVASHRERFLAFAQSLEVTE